ncbi:MAG: hypothetical protein JHC87_01785 [Thermoleophilaceae bacterium]|nr:hypothetical protein [Thermoleophilaceae bacterium]
MTPSQFLRINHGWYYLHEIAKATRQSEARTLKSLSQLCADDTVLCREYDPRIPAHLNANGTKGMRTQWKISGEKPAFKAASHEHRSRLAKRLASQTVSNT